MISEIDRENIDNFVQYYYDDHTNFNSLPRYFVRSLNCKEENTYERSKFVTKSHSGWAIADSLRCSGFEPESMENRRLDETFNGVSERALMRPVSSTRAGQSEFYDDEQIDDACSSSADLENRLRKEDKKTSAGKFLRYTSLRSLKKFVGKLKGKKKFDFVDNSFGPTSSFTSTRAAFEPDIALENPIFNGNTTDLGYSLRNDKHSIECGSPNGVKSLNHELRYQPNSYNLTARQKSPSDFSGMCLEGSEGHRIADRPNIPNSSRAALPSSRTIDFRDNYNLIPITNDKNAHCNSNNGRTVTTSGSNSNTGSAANSDIFTPALTGITNHGNTCYINAVVQCLSNNDQLAEYFLTNNYLPDLRLGQKNAEKYGSHGQVTKCLADFIHALWFKQYTPEVSINLKQTVERYSEQYKGSLQQDAQEFFIWLLDRVHEDLNVGVKRRYKLNKTRNKSDDEIACAAMEKHLEAHSSFISYQFHGLFLSSVTCPVCNKQSSQSDPFACVSLPVSQSTKKPLYVVMVFLNRRPRVIRFGLNADITATFLEVKQCLSKATDIAVGLLILCEMSPCGFGESFADDNEISSLNAIKCIYAIETPPIFSTNKAEELICLLCNQIGEGSAGRSFGAPVAIRIDREISYSDLCRTVLSAVRSQLKPALIIQSVPTSAFRLRVADDYHLLSYIPDDVSLPLYSQVVDNVFGGRHKSTGPSHLKIMIEWTAEDNERYLNSCEECIIDHKSAQDLKQQETCPESQTLQECLRDFTQDEYLQWYCPDCKKSQEKAYKRTLFYWLPNILTLHLKRNKQLANGQLIKLEPLVKFPVYGLDLTEFTHQCSPLTPRRNHPTLNGFNRTTKPRNGELYVDTMYSKNVYDLFAVCNHHGESPNSGHYTAYCRNPVSGYWYCFDDQNVTRIEESRLITNAAYMLFYEKRISRNISNSCHNSTESGFVDHWFFKVYSAYTNSPAILGHGCGGLLSVGSESREKLPFSDENASERLANKQMFVALPPKQPEKSREICGNRSSPTVGRLMSVEDANFRRNIEIEDSRPEIAKISHAVPKVDPARAIIDRSHQFSNGQRVNQSVLPATGRFFTNSLVETDL